MIQEIFFWLQFSSLVLVHLLLIILIILSIYIIFTVSALSSKTSKLLDVSKDKVNSIGDTAQEVMLNLTTNGLVSVMAILFGKKEKSPLEKLLSFLKK